MNIHWIGYSWFLGPNTSHLCVSRIESVQKKKIGDRVVKWPSKLEAVAPPDPGIVNTIGISGIGGYPHDAQTALSPQERSWRNQVQSLEDHFERLLADLLMGTINDILDVPNDEPLYIILQGPAFPKLLGRLSYQQLRQQHDNVHIYFMTFRRRFLTPSPLLDYEEIDPRDENDTFRGMIYGPVPSHHEEAIVRKYYVLPGVNPIAKPSGETRFDLRTGNYCPLLIETFEQNTARKNDSEALGKLLQAIGVTICHNTVIVPSDGSSEWQLYPGDFAFQKVLVPRKLLGVHKQSRKTLQSVMGEREAYTTNIVNRVFAEYDKATDRAAAREPAITKVQEYLDEHMPIN